MNLIDPCSCCSNAAPDMQREETLENLVRANNALKRDVSRALGENTALLHTLTALHGELKKVVGFLDIEMEGLSG